MKYLHTMIRIKNVDESLRFFCEGLGLQETRRMENEKGRFTLIFLAAPNDEKAEIELNADIAALFKTELGKKVLNYLKSITVDAVAGRDVTNDQLRHLEGMRYLYFLIKKRIETHREN